MALQGFDAHYYLTAKLSALQARFGEWGDRDIQYLEFFLAARGMTPEAHYRQYGWTEGLGPNPFFDPAEYRFAKANQLAAIGFSPSLEAGLDAFDTAWPRDPYQHYIRYGAAEGINPSNRFDQARYLSDKLTALRSDPVTAGQWTQKTTADLQDLLSDLGMTPVDHFLSYGAAEGLTATPVPEALQVDPFHTPWQLPHEGVALPAGLDLDWVDPVQITAMPHAAIGQLRITQEGKTNVGTGFLVSPDHVLTSAHVLLDDTGGLNPGADILFSPGLNGDIWAADTYGWSRAWVQHTFDADLYPGWPDNDLGLIRLDRPVNSTAGFLSLDPDAPLDLSGIPVQSAGYSASGITQDNPATPGPDYYQWEVAGFIDQTLYDNGALDLSDSMGVLGGASGSPVYYMDNDTLYLAGVVSGTLNNGMVAAAMDTDSLAWLSGILF